MTVESIEIGVITTVVGMGVVFCVLIILFLCVTLLAKVTEKSAAGKRPKPAAAVPVAPTVPAAPAPVKDKALDAKTVAVIMAAVSAALGRPAEQLRFRAVRHEGGQRSAWASEGTNEIIRTRQQYL